MTIWLFFCCFRSTMARLALQRMVMAAVLGLVLGFLANLVGFQWPKELQYLAMFAAVVDLCIHEQQPADFLEPLL